MERFSDHGNFLNNLAWQLIVEQPRPEVFAHAHRLAEAAILVDQGAATWNTLGVARFYVGELESALDALQESLRIEGWNVLDGLFIAMVHHELGNIDEAADWYESSLDELTRSPTTRAEVLRFREEARRLFGR